MIDVTELMAELNLPDLPESPDITWDTEMLILVLFRQNNYNVVLTNPVSYTDAYEYANREDTRGEGWFVGRDKPNDYEPGDVY